jgi:hypothetical protein
MGTNGQTEYMTYMFANPANTGFENTIIGSYYENTSINSDKQNNMFVVFCKAAGGAQKYQISFAKDSTLTKLPVISQTLQENLSVQQLHVSNPLKTEETSAPTCQKNAVQTLYCFCNIFI